jgi:hypothetical protein
MPVDLIIELLCPLFLLHKNQHWRNQLPLSNEVFQIDQFSQLVGAILYCLVDFIEDFVFPAYFYANAVVEVYF